MEPPNIYKEPNTQSHIHTVTNRDTMLILPIVDFPLLSPPVSLDRTATHCYFFLSVFFSLLLVFLSHSILFYFLLFIFHKLRIKTLKKTKTASSHCTWFSIHSNWILYYTFRVCEHVSAQLMWSMQLRDRWNRPSHTTKPNMRTNNATTRSCLHQFSEWIDWIDNVRFEASCGRPSFTPHHPPPSATRTRRSVRPALTRESGLRNEHRLFFFSSFSFAGFTPQTFHHFTSQSTLSCVLRFDFVVSFTDWFFIAIHRIDAAWHGQITTDEPIILRNDQ